jgi:PAS domain S-box-containing protein
MSGGQLASELSEERERFRLLVDGVKDYAIMMLDPEGRVASWNSGAERIKGYRGEEVIGRHFSLFYTPEAVASGHPEHELRIAREQGRYEEEGWRVRKDGSQFWANVVITALRDEHDALRGFAKVTRDMSDRRRADEAEREAREAAERGNRAKTRFLSAISHELRTPLNAILGFAQLLALDEPRDDQKEAVDQIRRAGQHLLGLVDELLDVARIEADQLTISVEPVAVDALIAECIALTSSLAAEYSIRILAPSRPDAGVFVLADTQRLRQAITNLLSNAVKYNRQHGHVRLEVDADGEHVVIAVTDSGPGLDPGSLDRLFAPFERLGTADGAVDGAGLGLALSKRLVELMGGSLTVETEIGQGTTFRIALAAAQPPIAEADDTPPLQQRPQLPATVLYIEDNVANLRLVELVLSRLGDIDVLSAGHGQLGMELARAHQPDVILLDLHLPDMGGDEVAIALRADESTRAIPIIILSADAYPSQRRRLLELGVDEYLTKPFKVAEMLELVERFAKRTRQEGLDSAS